MTSAIIRYILNCTLEYSEILEAHSLSSIWPYTHIISMCISRPYMIQATKKIRVRYAERHVTAGVPRYPEENYSPTAKRSKSRTLRREFASSLRAPTTEFDR